MSTKNDRSVIKRAQHDQEIYTKVPEIHMFHFSFLTGVVINFCCLHAKRRLLLFV